MTAPGRSPAATASVAAASSPFQSGGCARPMAGARARSPAAAKAWAASDPVRPMNPCDRTLARGRGGISGTSVLAFAGMQRIFVTGGTGFVGKVLVRELLAHGFLVRCLVRPGSERDLRGFEAIDRVPGDVLDPADLVA